MQSESTLLEAVGTRGGKGPGSCAAILEDGERAGRLRLWCRRELATTHLVETASTLRRQLRASLEDLEALGLPTDVLRAFPRWRQGSRAGFRPRANGLRAAAATADDSKLSYRLQISPVINAIPYALVLLRQLLRRVPSAEFAVVVEPDAGLREVQRIVDTFGRRYQSRIRLVQLAAATAFAQDNALGMRDGSGDAALLIPRSFGHATHRESDALSLADAEAALEVRVVQSSLWWEGGNILCDGVSLLIGVDTIRENMVRMGLRRSEVLALFRAEMGSTPTVLGDLRASRWDAEKGRTKSGQADFHIDLDLAPVGVFGRRRKPIAFIADVVRGLDMVDAVVAHAPLTRGGFLPVAETRAILAEQYDDYARARHPILLRYCEQLERLGYRVVGVPDVRVVSADCVYTLGNADFGYCNILPGRGGDRPSVYYLPSGIGQLDGLAEAQFRGAGVEPVAVSKDGTLGNQFMRMRGGLHCICGPWR